MSKNRYVAGFISVLMSMAMVVSTYAVEIVADMGTSGDLATQGFTNGIAPAGLPNNTQPTYTFVYDLSGAGLAGGADGMEIKVTSVNTSNVVGTGFGFSVDGGGSHNWWEVDEDVSFEVKITKLGQDVTSYYSVDLTGSSLRWAAGQTATLAGTAISGTGGNTINTSSLPTGETGETSFAAERDQSGLTQFSQLRFDITNITPVPTMVEVVTDLGSLATGFSGGLSATAYPDGSSPLFSYVYDISSAGLDGGAATLEVLVTSSNGYGLVNGGGFGLAVDGGNGDLWWDTGEDLEFEITIRNALFEDITSSYGIDLTGAALRWNNTAEATVAGTTISGASSGTATYTSELPTGETNETSFTAVRGGASTACQFAQLRFVLYNTDPMPGAVDVVADMGCRSELNTQGYAAGMNPASLPDGTTPSHTFIYDVSSAGIGGNAATLEVLVSSQSSSNLTSGGGWGVTVNGGANNLWWDTGEDLDFELSIRDASGVDITRFFWVDLTGASLRWNNGNSATIAGTSISGNGGSTIIYKDDLPSGENAETSFSGARGGASSACQFSQLRFRIAPIPVEPTTFTALSEVAASATPPSGWAFYWNAPTNWTVGTVGDLTSGAVTDRSSWKPLVWSGSMWTADGDTTSNNSPSDFLRITSTGGHTGGLGSSTELDRYPISAFTIGQAGDYELLLGKVSTHSSGNGVLVKIFLNGSQHDELVVPNNDDAEFSYIFNGLTLNDEIAVAVGANGNTSFDNYTLDYRIALLKPEYANPQIFNVADYGATGDGVTDDGPAVLDAINVWKNTLGPVALHFETNKTYYLGEKTDAMAYFVLNGISHKVVEGNGAKLVFTPSNRGFDISDCDDIVVRNFSVDYSPLPFAQGIITATDSGAGTITFQKSAGYSDPILPPIKNWGTVYDPSTLNLRAGIDDHLYVDSITNLGSGIFEFQVQSDYQDNIAGIQTNDLFVFRGYEWNTGIPGNQTWANIKGNGNVAFDNIHVQCAPAFAFTPGENIEPTLFRDIIISPPEGSGRLVSSFGDGLHCGNNRYGPVIEGGHFTYLMDDTINLKSTGFILTEIVSNNTIKVDTDDHWVGDEFQFTDAYNATVLGKATVLDINGDVITLDALPAGVETNQYVFNLSRANAGYVVQDNYFGIKRRTAAIIRCGNGKVLNNVADGNSGFWLGNEFFNGVHEGPYAENILFQGNTIRNCRYGLWIKASYTASGSEMPLQNIRILDNVFEDSVNMDISDAGNLTIDGNEFWVTPIGELNTIGPIAVGNNTDENGLQLTGGTSLFTGSFAAGLLSFAPVATPQSASVSANGSLAITLSGSDGDNDPLTYAVATQPVNGTLTGTAPNLTYTPDVDYIGADSFSFMVNDGSASSPAATVSITVTPAGPDIRVTEYYLTTGDFSGTTATVTLDQDLADDYYILVRGSRTGDGTSNPNNDYARISAVPGGKGDLPDSGAADEIDLHRQAANFDWEGVVTVVECGNSASPDGFTLVDVVETAMTGSSGTDAGAVWSDIDQVVLFGGYRGGGVEMFGSPTNRKQGTGCYSRLYPSGTNTLNWSRDAGGETMFDAMMTTFVVEWGSQWTVQHANVAGSNGGDGANATGEYTTAAISSVNRDNTWIWGTGTRADSGIGDCSESCLVTLGDGVNQNASEATVAVGSEYTDAYDFDVYVLTHSDLAVDHLFKADGDATGLDVPVTVDSTTAGARFGWVYNGCNGTGAAFPRPRFWARYTADGEVTISRGYDGQAFPAWVQGIDLSGLNE